GTNEIAESDGPAGVAALTDTMWVREPLSGVAPVIVTFSGGGAAVVGMVKVPVVCPAGMVIDTGTCAAEGSLENSRTTVGSGSAKGSSTVPVVDWPSRTESGLIDRAPMVPAAIAGAGSRASAPRRSTLIT